MALQDWLVGDRHDAAADRIYAGATALITRRGYDAFTIDALAAAIHCSPATIYRHTGGKAAIRDEVVARLSLQVVDTVRREIAGLHGSDRVVTATAVALREMRSEPFSPMMRAVQPGPGSDWLTASPIVTGLAAEMLAQSTPDPLAAQWLIRVVMSLWFWPLKDTREETEMLRRLLGPPFDG
ncbi:TetR/AcrR family transcriptional regulator [[Mycobacterium] burgundiense]|jgi:AcrR family transcriptional regulator|uniref:Helix-turn-helix domain-containing protein n=1 Tax=[Mycobacterium] burgundiense TaxID=3064286 RepID=A0ABM9LZ96_9MYCO|nr:TetR/AcrR family transcriptional regulator [Mycolicibacterium sp. MU0053]CAJ1507301.1 helix-turn-helix domain-containing protein [Mycolicibacterium sp. MU0053]